MPAPGPWLPRRRLATLVAAGVVAVLSCPVVWTGVQGIGPGADGPVYTMATLQAHLQQEPAQWLDRSVKVRAVPTVCLPCGDWLPGLTDPGANPTTQFLPLVSGDTPRLLAFLRHLPLVGHIFPQPQDLVWDRPAVYAVQLRRIDCLLPREQGRVCAAAVLVNAAPES
jgi:hypothetical protein